MKNWTEEELDQIFNKGEEWSDNKHKKDVAGAIIYRDSRDNTDMAWEVDHIFPEAILQYFGIKSSKIDDMRNVRPLHHSNNSSKGDNFPLYTYNTTSEGNKNVTTNVQMKPADSTMKELRDLFEKDLRMTLEEASKQYHEQNK